MRQEHLTSRQNPLLVHIRKLQASRSYRKASGEFAAEGTKLLEEAAKWYPGLHTVVCREGLRLCKLPEQVRVVTVPEDVFKSISTVDTPQGAIFLCRLPDRQQADLTAGTLLLDGIQDPGNLGTMLRTADALGVPIALLDGCADPYSFKTVRASMGAVFRMDIPAITEAEVLTQPAGSHPLSPYKNRQCRIKQHCRDWLSMRCPRRPCSWRACRRPGIRRTGVPARTACSGWKALLRSSWLPHRPGHRTTWF